MLNQITITDQKAPTTGHCETESEEAKQNRDGDGTMYG